MTKAAAADVYQQAGKQPSSKLSVSEFNLTKVAWRNGKALELQSRGREFNSQSGHYQVVSTSMGDCRQTGKPSWYITNHRSQLSLPSLPGR